MSTEAIKTIQIHNWKMSAFKAKKIAQHFVDLIQAAYPLGIENTENETYFVLPGFEHVTKNQPVAGYNPTEGQWELQAKTQFLLSN